MDTIEDIQEFCSKNLVLNIVMFDVVYSHKKLVHVSDLVVFTSTLHFCHSCGQWLTKVLVTKL